MRINREDLLSHLEMLRPGLSPQEVTEQSASFIFQDGWCQTFNDEIAMSQRSPLKITGAVSATPLISLLQKMVEEEIDVEPTDSELIVSGKRRRAGIRMDSEITAPLDKVERPTAWTQLPEDFCEAINIVQGCAGKDESKFLLTCIQLHPKWIQACDNFQATRYRIVTGLNGPVLVRRDSIKHIVGLGMTEFCETETWLHFRNPSKVILSCRRFVEDYPPLKEFFAFEGEPATLPRGLAEAADRAGDFSSQNADDNLIEVSLTAGEVTVTGKSDIGWYEESKKIKYSGKPIKFLVSPKMLTEIVKRHTECQIGEGQLKVDGGKWIFTSCLGKADEVNSED